MAKPIKEEEEKEQEQQEEEEQEEEEEDEEKEEEDDGGDENENGYGVLLAQVMELDEPWLGPLLSSAPDPNPTPEPDPYPYPYSPSPFQFLDSLPSLPQDLCHPGTECPQIYGGVALEPASHSKVLNERMASALRAYIAKSRADVLAQVWVPVKQGNRLVLTTDGQPFVLGQSIDGLWSYRSISTLYVFSVDEKDPDTLPGLPGRVFLGRAPEWTPNVQYYSKDEYLRLNEAAICNVQGSIGLPIIDRNLRSCVAVLELVMSSEMIEYGDEIDSICLALQAVDLCSTIGRTLTLNQLPTNHQQDVLVEIEKVLAVVSEAHGLPLAQAWLPFPYGVLSEIEYENHPDWKGTSPEEYISSRGVATQMMCLFTREAPFFIGDMSILGFRHACAEHFLEREQGVPGKAYTSNQPFFSANVQSYSKLEYPLGHYARKFGLVAAVAVRLRSLHTGPDDYILEFFLPQSCLTLQDQRSMLHALSVTMQRASKSLRTLTEKELNNWNQSVEDTGSTNLDAYQTPSKRTRLLVECGNPFSEQEQGSYPPESKPILADDNGAAKRRQERRRGSAEKTISLSVLQQYFSGSLKDAAKSIGVCPTTLKRICRQHGIPRWPSRKINQVNRSLKKLQGVIDSVHGADNSALQMKAGSCSTTAPSLQVGAMTDQAEGDKQLFGLHQDLASPSFPFDDCNSSLWLYRETLNTGEYPRNKNLSHCKPENIEEDMNLAMDASGFSGSSSSQASDSTSPSSASAEDIPRKTPLQVREEKAEFVTVKAKYGNDMVRFKLKLMGSTPSFLKLKEEVSKRFSLGRDLIDLKYLDDDEEWVMLACEEDLQECLHIFKKSGCSHIKLMVRELKSLHPANS